MRIDHCRQRSICSCRLVNIKLDIVAVHALDRLLAGLDGRLVLVSRQIVLQELIQLSDAIVRGSHQRSQSLNRQLLRQLWGGSIGHTKLCQLLTDLGIRPRVCHHIHGRIAQAAGRSVR